MIRYQLKKMHNLKVENCVLCRGFLEDFSLEDSLADTSAGLLRRGKGGAKMYRSFAKKNR